MNHIRHLVPWALLLLGACGGGDDGDGGNGGQNGVCKGNGNVDSQSAVALAAGAEQQGTLCPVRNQHWFRIEVPAGQPLVTVSLRNDTPLSPVTLAYSLRAADGSTLVDQPPPPQKQAGAKQNLQFTHCVRQPGTYYLQVQSYGDDAQDPRNPFTISYSTGVDRDSNEPGNNDLAGAVTASGAQTGYITCKGDQDFYRVSVPAQNLLQVSLTSTEITPALSLRYRILDDQQRLVATDGVRGNSAPANLRVIRTVPAAGTYYVVVEDQGGGGADPKVPYKLELTPIPEPDQNDRAAARNDLPAGATLLGSFTCGGPVSFGKPAYLASRSDIDWYKVNTSGVGPACQATIDVDAAWGGGANGSIAAQVLLVYPDPGTTCQKDEDCRVLKRDCGGDDNRCEYYGNQCARPMNQCTGASVCLPDKVCGVIQYEKHMAMPAAPTSVRTSQPLVAASAYYIGIRDFSIEGYDVSTAYNLAVRLDGDDAAEPNNFYSPYKNPDAGLMRNASFVMRNKITLGTSYSGRIAYERDRDYYVFDHPCPGSDCTLKVEYATDAASPVYFTYQLEQSDGSLWAGWPDAPATRMARAPRIDPPAVLGDGQKTCLYASRRHSGSYFLWVGDLLKGGPLWDHDTRYSFKITKVQDGCSDFCKAAPYNCGS